MGACHPASVRKPDRLASSRHPLDLTQTPGETIIVRISAVSRALSNCRLRRPGQGG